MNVAAAHTPTAQLRSGSRRPAAETPGDPGPQGTQGPTGPGTVTLFLGVDRYDHGKPADSFLRKRDQFLPKLQAATIARFEALFVRANATLPLKP